MFNIPLNQRKNVMQQEISPSADESTPCYIDCPFCEMDYSRAYLTGKSFRLVQCDKCGLIYLNPRQADAKGIYMSAYFDDEQYYADYEASSHAFRRAFRSRLKIINKYLDSGQLLDVGTAFGDFMSEAKAFGFDPHGVELAPDAAQSATLIGPVYCGDWMSYESDKKFDIITFNDSLEHFANPVHAIRKAKAMLKRDGFIGTMVPNIGSWFAKLTGPRWCFISPEEHLFHFTPRTIRQIFEREGFKILHIKSLGHGRTLGDVLAVLLRGTGLGRKLVRGPLRKIVLRINLGDLFVLAQKGRE